jgi:hypothetical protein
LPAKAGRALAKASAQSRLAPIASQAMGEAPTGGKHIKFEFNWALRFSASANALGKNSVKIGANAVLFLGLTKYSGSNMIYDNIIYHIIIMSFCHKRGGS